MQRHLPVFELYWNKAALGSVVEPFEVVGAVASPFSVLTHVIVWATAEKSSTRTCEICPSTALAVAIVIVMVAAELFVTVLTFDVIGTVAAFPDAVIALLDAITCGIVCTPVHVFAFDKVGTVSHSTAITPAETLDIVVSVA